MKVTTEIDVTPSAYFKHLCDITIQDVKKATNKVIVYKDLIDGYHYDKYLSYKGKSAHISMNVGPLIENNYFMMAYETEETKCLYYYDFFTKDNKYYVTYFEDNKYKKDTIGTKLANFRYKLSKNALKKKIFHNIELTTTYIKNNHNKEE